MKIEINVQNAHLKAEEIQENHVTNIIEGFFGLLGFVKGVEKTTAVLSPKINVSLTDPEPEVNRKSISKVLPKINADRTLSAPIREIAKITQKNGTGIKEFEDGSIKYQCKYWCDCGHDGKRWINDTTQHVHCHDCNRKIIVEPATPDFRADGLPEQDKFGNFFIAREMEIEYEAEVR